MTTHRVWIHATTPEHGAAAEVLAETLATLPDAPKALVTGTARVPGPADDPRTLDGMFDQVSPSLVVLIGSLLPLPLIDRARARGVPMMLVDTEDPVPAGGWRIVPGYTRAVLKRFTQIHTRDTHSAAALPRAVHEAVTVRDTGTLARWPTARPCNQGELESLRAALGTRPVWYACALPESEQAAILAAQAQLLRRSQRLLLVLHPRSLAQVGEIVRQAGAAGLSVSLAPDGDDIDETSQVHIVDPDDPAGVFLRLSSICWLGGTLSPGLPVPVVTEAIALGSALIFGSAAPPEGRDLLDRLQALGGGLRISQGSELASAVAHFLGPDTGAQAALRAWTLASAGAEATLAVAHAIRDLVAEVRR